jgi:hypothetical protein
MKYDGVFYDAVGISDYTMSAMMADQHTTELPSQKEHSEQPQAVPN